MKRIIELPDKVVKAIQNGEDYRYDIHTAIAQSKPYDDSGDLISRRDLQAKHDESCAGECACCAYGVDYTKSSDSKFHCLLIDNAQTVELYCAYLSDNEVRQPCVEARPQGEWVFSEKTDHWKCSKCGELAPLTYSSPSSYAPYVEWLSNICPSCGADMRESEAENE